MNDKIAEALDNARLGIVDKTSDTPVGYAGFNVWEQMHTVTLVQAIAELIREARIDENDRFQMAVDTPANHDYAYKRHRQLSKEDNE